VLETIVNDPRFDTFKEAMLGVIALNDAESMPVGSLEHWKSVKLQNIQHHLLKRLEAALNTVLKCEQDIANLEGKIADSQLKVVAAQEAKEAALAQTKAKADPITALAGDRNNLCELAPDDPMGGTPSIPWASTTRQARDHPDPFRTITFRRVDRVSRL
jgi:hypothetical protein